MNIPIIGQTQKPPTQTVPCPKCTQPLEVPALTFEVLNSETTSMIIWSRGQLKTVCASCGQRFAPISAFDPRAIQAQLIPLEAKAEESKILH